MLNRVFLLFLILLTPTITFAEVPHIFLSGTPARAQHVNDNFEDVTERIELNGAEIDAAKIGIIFNTESVTSAHTKLEELEVTLSSQIAATGVTLSEINETLAAKIECYGFEHVSYEKKLAQIGQAFPGIKNDTYYVIRAGFKDFDSGNPYSIKYISTAGLSATGASLKFHHQSEDLNCENAIVDGYPAQIIVKEYQKANLRHGNFSYVYFDVEVWLNIKVENVRVEVLFDYRVDQGNANVINGYDFTQILDINEMEHDLELLEFLDDLIDYTEIAPL